MVSNQKKSTDHELLPPARTRDKKHSVDNERNEMKDDNLRKSSSRLPLRFVPTSRMIEKFLAIATLASNS